MPYISSYYRNTRALTQAEPHLAVTPEQLPADDYIIKHKRRVANGKNYDKIHRAKHHNM